MWAIVATCIELCSGDIKSPVLTYATKRDCDRAIVTFAAKVNPGNGAYSFKCVRS